MITEDIKKNSKTGIIELVYDGIYPSEEEIISEVEKHFGKNDYEILDVESEGTSGRVFLK